MQKRAPEREMQVQGLPDQDSTTELISFFHANWQKTAGAFCDLYALDKKQFRKWLKLKGPYSAGAAAVQTFQRQFLASEILGQRKPPTPNLSLAEMRSLIQRLAPRQELNTFILIDGDMDGAFGQLRRLKWILPSDGSDQDAHVLIVVNARTIVPPSWTPPAWCSLVRLRESLPNQVDYVIGVAVSLWTHLRLAAELPAQVYILARDKFADALAKITQDVYGVKCQAVDPGLVQFSLLYAVASTTSRLSAKGAEARAVLQHHLKSDLGDVADLQQALERIPLPDLGYPTLAETLRFFRGVFRKQGSPQPESISKPALSATAPPFEPKAATGGPRFQAGNALPADFYKHPVFLSLKELLQSKSILYLAEIAQRLPNSFLIEIGQQKWSRFLSLPQVQNMLQADYLPVTAENPAPALRLRSGPRNPAAKVPVREMDDNQLRHLWRLLWLGSMEEFCRRYVCKREHFSTWVNEKRWDSPPSSAAVRAWLIETGYEQV